MENHDKLDNREAFKGSIENEHKDVLDARMKRIKEGTQSTKSTGHVSGESSTTGIFNATSVITPTSLGESLTMNPSSDGGSMRMSTMSSADIDAAVKAIETIWMKFQDEVNKAGGTQLSSSPKASTSSPLVSPSTTINVPRELNTVDVDATFRVSLTTIGDLHKLINDIEADDSSNLNVDESTIPSDPIIQFVDINTKSTSYAEAAGASTKDQPKVNSNFRTLVADPVFDGVNVFIPCKFFKKGGPWLICKSPIILKKWSMDTRLLKEELTRIPIWVKLYDVPIQVFEEDGISLIATFI
nr:zinc knuckle CX2CX4HX4C [Tanacetum cinerariifolium]